MSAVIIWLVIIFLGIVVASIRQINQYQRGVKFTFGKFTGVMEPGWRLVFPVIQFYKKVDVRTKAVDVLDQEAITKDNVSARTSAVIFYRVTDSAKAVLEVENFAAAVHQLAQTTMRNVMGETELNDLLTQRDSVADRIRDIVSETTTGWGLEVLSVELKDINLPESMIRTMAKRAEAERERQATIINSEGEVVAAGNLSKAAELMANSPGALHLRTLNSINDISSDQSNTVVFAVPMEVLRAFEGLQKYMNKGSSTAETPHIR